MVGVETGVVQQPAHGRIVLGVGRSQLPAGLFDVVQPPTPPDGVDLIATGGDADSLKYAPARACCQPASLVSCRRRRSQGYDDYERCTEQDRGLEPSCQPLGSIQEAEATLGWPGMAGLARQPARQPEKVVAARRGSPVDGFPGHAASQVTRVCPGELSRAGAPGAGPPPRPTIPSRLPRSGHRRPRR